MLLKYIPSGLSGMRDKRELGILSLFRATRRGCNDSNMLGRCWVAITLPV